MIALRGKALDVACEATGMTREELIAYQQQALNPTFTQLREAFEKNSATADVIAASCTHLSEDEQAELLKLAVKAPKRKRGRK